jgi:hypothetical protein
MRETEQESLRTKLVAPRVLKPSYLPLRLVQRALVPFEDRESDAVLEFRNLLTQSRLADG